MFSICRDTKFCVPTKKDALDSKTAPQYLPEPHDEKYMNVVLHQKDMLNNLYDEYGTDLFVFINQFEIKTNYASCLDIANRIYKREVRVHFSVFDKNGRQVSGNYALSFFPSDSSNEDDIIKNCFPELAAFVTAAIP